MNDKELLLMAARAYSKDIFEGDGGYGADRMRGTFYYSVGGNGGVREWNPLKRDCDALRLAVKLKMDVCVHHISGFVDVYAYREAELICETEYCENDSLAATRRAIVRAAAGIGSKL